MKKLILVLLALVMVAGCALPTPEVIVITATPEPIFYGKYPESMCELNWKALDVQPGDENKVASIVVNRVHLPDSIGHVVEECINNGWTGWRLLTITPTPSQVWFCEHGYKYGDHDEVIVITATREE